MGRGCVDVQLGTTDMSTARPWTVRGQRPMQRHASLAHKQAGTTHHWIACGDLHNYLWMKRHRRFWLLLPVAVCYYLRFFTSPRNKAQESSNPLLTASLTGLLVMLMRSFFQSSSMTVISVPRSSEMKLMKRVGIDISDTYRYSSNRLVHGRYSSNSRKRSLDGRGSRC